MNLEQTIKFIKDMIEKAMMQQLLRATRRY